jgi:Zn-dependent M28 family amino/carboxypeptidase
MNASVESIWQNQAAGRKRIRKLIAVIFLLFSLLLVFIWFWLTQPMLGGGSPSRTVEVPPVRLETHVRALSEQFSPRDYTHPENLDRAAAYVHQEFLAAKATVVDLSFMVNGKTYRNVSATFGPDTAERIVVGAHYDSAGPMPAADDNASGIAGLIELAYLLGKSPPTTRVELVAYTLEEPPYFRTADMGSAHHARDLRAGGVGVRAMIALEMIGYFTDQPDSQQFPSAVLGLFYPSTGNFISVVGTLSQGLLVRRVKGAMRASTSLPVYSINAPAAIPGVDFSDHLNYWRAGYPALMITDTAFYRNHAYHTAQDTADRLNYPRMAMVVQGVYAAILELSR